MKVKELLSELTFMGHTCTKDCSGHEAGYNYGLKNKLTVPTNTPSKSFDSGTGIAAKQTKTKKTVKTATTLAAPTTPTTRSF